MRLVVLDRAYQYTFPVDVSAFTIENWGYQKCFISNSTQHAKHEEKEGESDVVTAATSHNEDSKV
jgi:hypothetical protein